MVLYDFEIGSPDFHCLCVVNAKEGFAPRGLPYAISVQVKKTLGYPDKRNAPPEPTDDRDPPHVNILLLRKAVLSGTGHLELPMVDGIGKPLGSVKVPGYEYVEEK